MGNNPSYDRPAIIIRSDVSESENPTSNSSISPHQQQQSQQHNEPLDEETCHVCTGNNASYSVNSNINASQPQLANTSKDACDERSNSSSQQQQNCPPCFAYANSACPLNRNELGRASWAYLHSLAAYYPAKPTQFEQQRMKRFMEDYAKLYPCGYCSDRTVEELQRRPPDTSSQSAFAIWMCEVHNEVNERLNKPLFDCSKVDERWRTGAPQCRQLQSTSKSTKQ
jgi:mitochondrial FAD-linked sulfhydryl oxidase